jgi:hypothetical protein
VTDAVVVGLPDVVIGKVVARDWSSPRSHRRDDFGTKFERRAARARVAARYGMEPGINMRYGCS